jgi:cell division septum initiation protein DivIVA
MFTEDDREVHNREQEAWSVIGDSSGEDIIFVIYSLIQQNSELASKLEETVYQAKVAQEQIAEAVRQRDTLRIEAERMMAEARQSADKYFQEKVLLTEQEAKEIVKSAEAKAEAITRLAEHKARRIIDEAKQIADKDRQEAQKNKNETGVETGTTGVVASGNSADKVSAEEGQEQSRRGYVWESDGLAWVEAGELVVSQPLPEVLNAPDTVEIDEKAIEQKQSMPTRVNLYKGSIEMLVKSQMSVELRKFSKHLHNLKSTHGIRVLGVNSSGQDLVIRLSLQYPVPLLDILKALPEVHKLYDDPEDGGKTQRSRFKPDKPIARNIVVELIR